MDEEPAPTTTVHNDALEACEDDNFSIFELEHEPRNLAGKYENQAFINIRNIVLAALVKDGTFVSSPTEEVPNGTDMFWSKLLDELKLAREGLKQKSRLVAQG